MDSLLLMQNHGHLELTNDALQEKFERITSGHDRVRERFFAGAQRPKSAAAGERAPRVPTAPSAPKGSASSSSSAQATYRRRNAPRTNMLNFEIVDGKEVAVALKAPPRQTYQQTVQKDESNQPVAKWPVELELRYPPPAHSEAAPAEPEPFYFAPKQTPTRIATGGAKAATISGGPGFGSSAARMTMGGMGRDEYQPRKSPAAEARAKQHKTIGQVLYTRGTEGHPWFVPGATRTYNANAATLEPSYVPEDENDIALVFDSRFESGNLEEAKRTGEFEYDLRLQNDLYTSRHTQWFYFSITNCRKGSTYKFNITNLLKPDSLYNHGMQPCVYSDVAAAQGAGWRRGGVNVRYFKTKRKVESVKIERQRYSLTWEYTCTEDGDTLYFAHCYPYTYTMLQTYLTKLAQDPERSQVIRQRVLCRSLCDNVCDLLTVTRFGCSSDEMAARKGIVITSRVHPGESNASWMMKGFIDFITSNDPDAVTLRNHFIFKICPMLNPDGVIAGNYRTGLAGVDLNRVYKVPIRELYPTVYNVKSMMKRFQQDREVVLYIDLHGHSRKHNVFAYGCDNSLRGGEKMQERVFIKMLELNGPSHFSLKDSRFHVKKAKDSTGRVNTWKELDLMNTFTVEATFCGSTQGKLANMQYSHKDFEKVGSIICDSIMDYFDPDTAKKEMIFNQLTDKYADGGDDADSSDEAADSPGSDSTESDGAGEAATTHFKTAMGVPFTYQLNVGQPRKKELKTRKQLEKARGKRGTTKTNRRKKGVSRLAKPKVVREEPRVSSAPAKRTGKGRGAGFVSRYDGQSNNGVPSFSEKQAQERKTKISSQNYRQSTYRYDMGHPVEPAGNLAANRLHGQPFEEDVDNPGPSMASAFASAVHDRLYPSAEPSESQEQYAGVEEEDDGDSATIEYARMNFDRAAADSAHLRQSIAEAKLIRQAPVQPHFNATHGNERLIQQLMQHDSDTVQSSDGGEALQTTVATSQNTDLVLSTLDMLRHKVHDDFVKEQAAFSQRDPTWESVEEQPAQTQLNTVTPMFNPEGHTGFSAAIGSPQAQRRERVRKQAQGSPKVKARHKMIPNEGDSGMAGTNSGVPVTKIVPSFGPRGSTPRQRVWKKSTITTSKGALKASEARVDATFAVAAANAAPVTETSGAEHTGLPASANNEVPPADPQETPPLLSAHQPARGNGDGGGDGGDDETPVPPASESVDGPVDETLAPVSAMERLAAAMQSKRAKVALTRATSPVMDPGIITTSVDHSAEPLTPRPGSAGNPLSPLTFRRCVCDAHARHEIRELRGHTSQFGGHMVRCRDCQGFAPDNQSRRQTNRPPSRNGARPASSHGPNRPASSRGTARTQPEPPQQSRPMSRREFVRPTTQRPSQHASMKL